MVFARSGWKVYWGGSSRYASELAVLSNNNSLVAIPCSNTNMHDPILGGSQNKGHLTSGAGKHQIEFLLPSDI